MAAADSRRRADAGCAGIPRGPAPGHRLRHHLVLPSHPPERGMNGAPVLQTVGLEKRFGGVHAIAGVDFTLADGELRCLIGPNGAGKSTFFKMLTGQLPPSA